MGTDTGGSMRMPASLDGVVGLKPTYGRVSRYGVVPLSWSLDHCGPLTRTVEDAALLLQPTAGYDSRDPSSASEPVDDPTSDLRAGIRGLRLGVPRNYFFDRIHRAVANAFEQAMAVLEDLGAIRVDVTLPGIELALSIGVGILMPEASSIHQQWLRQTPERYDEGTRRMLEAGELQLATHYLQATRIDQLTVDFGEAGQEPFFSTFVRQTIPFNVSGLPALSVPCGFSVDTEDGRIGHTYQTVTDWHTRRPPL
jgi:aspartyl-tRNA(Asn)/glutamyl-tRNA(Gln) amidotransferase subunit A